MKSSFIFINLMKKTTLLLATLLAFSACKEAQKTKQPSPYQPLADQYAEFPLTTDLSKLTDNEKKMIPLLIQAADLMEEIYWHNAYGNKQELFQGVTDSALILIHQLWPMGSVKCQSSFCG